MKRFVACLMALSIFLLFTGCDSITSSEPGGSLPEDAPSGTGSMVTEETPTNNHDENPAVSEGKFEFDPLQAGVSVASGSCGENVIWTLYEDGTMVISGTGDMEPQLWRVFDSWDDCEEYTEQVINLIIEDGVTSIADSAFSYFSSLQNVTIADSVTSIGTQAFRSCWNITTIDIPDSITNIGESAFLDCRGLIDVYIPSNVTSIGNSTFEACEALQSIAIPDGIETIGWGMFAGCSNLESVEIPASVTTIGQLSFLGCNKLADVYFGGSETEWDAIAIEKTDAGLIESMGYSAEDDECLTRAAIHYNSTMP